MTTPINLNKFRKAKAKAGKTQSAKENRTKFGRTKSNKELDKALAEKAQKLIDSKKMPGDEVGEE